MTVAVPRLSRKCCTRLCNDLLDAVKTCIVSSLVPCVPLTVIAVIGMFVGTRVTDSNELSLLRRCRGTGMLIIGRAAIEVSTLGRRVVLLVLVTTRCSLCFLVEVLHLTTLCGT